MRAPLSGRCAPPPRNGSSARHLCYARRRAAFALRVFASDGAFVCRDSLAGLLIEVRSFYATIVASRQRHRHAPPRFRARPRHEEEASSPGTAATAAQREARHHRRRLALVPRIAQAARNVAPHVGVSLPSVRARVTSSHYLTEGARDMSATCLPPALSFAEKSEPFPAATEGRQAVLFIGRRLFCYPSHSSYLAKAA